MPPATWFGDKTQLVSARAQPGGRFRTRWTGWGRIFLWPTDTSGYILFLLQASAAMPWRQPPMWFPLLSATATGYLAPIVISIVIYAVILGLLYKYGAHTAFAREFNKNSTPAAILAIVNSGGVYLIVLAASAQYAKAVMDFAYNVAAATFGLAMGWVLGIVTSPGSKDEASEFSLLTKAVSTFLTGYVLANLKDVTRHQVWDFLNMPGIAFRLLIGTACCFSTVAVVFVSRRAEITKANATRDWFISYTPADAKFAQGLRSDLLARGPFSSRDEAVAEIELLKGRDEFQGVTLAPVRVDIVAEPTAPPPSPKVSQPPVDAKTAT